VIARLFSGAALLGMICSPALAGQVTIIGADGQVTSSAMPTNAKMVKMMHKMGHVMGKGPLMVWMDDKGSMHRAEKNPPNLSWADVNRLVAL
jgi:hypothetical protein